MMRRDAENWSRKSRWLHWGMALLIAIEVPVAVAMSSSFVASLTDKTMIPRLHLLSAMHHTIGLLILMLAIARLVTRLTGHDPVSGTTLARPLRLIAAASHAGLYLIMIALPLSGWAALSAYRVFPTYFGPFHLFPIVAKVPLGQARDYAFFAHLHGALWKVGRALLLLHVSAALWHHWVRRDGVLRAMIGRRASEAPRDDELAV